MLRGIWKKLKHSVAWWEHPSLKEAASSNSPNPSSFHDSLASKTHFPEFDLESLPDGELTDVSDTSDTSDDGDDDDESSADSGVQQQRDEKYRTIEDQDVAVFLSMAKHMSLRSLLHLLQAQAMANDHNHMAQSQSSNHPILVDDDSDETTTQPKSSFNNNNKKPLAKRQKQFRFCEVRDHQVRVVVHEVERWKHMKELWTQPEEAQAIRSDLIQTVQYFRRNRPLYTQAVEIVANSTECKSVVEQHMRVLMEDSCARGLEAHVVSLLSENRKETVRAVLQEQSDCRSAQDTDEMTSYCLREKSLVTSPLSTGFAKKMGQCDQIEALKAKMSRWRPSPQAPSSDFWNNNTSTTTNC
jgi:hypothetical protein